MNKFLLATFALVLGVAMRTNAQSTNYIWYSVPWDSTYFHFDTAQFSNIVTDGSDLWQVGTTTKPFFSSGNSALRTIMTDSTSSYPVDANAWFLFPVPLNGFTTLSFWHKYQTAPGHDGGIVEISSDNGNSWDNVKGMCNLDSSWGIGAGVLTDNFYGFNDTLDTGEPAFTGTSNGWQLSRFQLFWCCPIKSSESTDWCPINDILVRFRFKSDNIAESLDGWIIDSLLVELDMPMSLSANEVHPLKQLDVYPNPSYNGVIHFPALPGEEGYHLDIINSIGQKVLTENYKRSIDLGTLPKGLYFYRVTNGTGYYSGQIILE